MHCQKRTQHVTKTKYLGIQMEYLPAFGECGRVFLFAGVWRVRTCILSLC